MPATHEDHLVETVGCGFERSHGCRKILIGARRVHVAGVCGVDCELGAPAQDAAAQIGLAVANARCALRIAGLDAPRVVHVRLADPVDAPLVHRRLREAFGPRCRIHALGAPPTELWMRVELDLFAERALH